MIIESVAASLPERKVGNEEIIDIIRFNSKSFDGDLAKSLRMVKTRLERSGLITRHWLSGGERPIDHVDQAVRAALKTSSIRPNDVDLFIYVGVGGGFHKLGNAYILAKTLGLLHAECFDILDACMSWTRALSLAKSLFKTRHIRNALIVNAEFNMIEGAAGFPENYTLRHPQELDYLYPSYTIGEAASATLLLPTAPDNLSVSIHSKPDYADLCMIPTEGYQGYFDVSHMVAQLGQGRFSALGREIHERIAEELPTALSKSQIDLAEADIVFTHSSSMKSWDDIGKRLGFSDKTFHIYPEAGNVVSASIPAAMALAQRAGKLAKGHRVVFLMGSAGMSFAAGKFVY